MKGYDEQMTRFERIKDMSIDEMAREIISLNVIDDHCKGKCALGSDCPHEEKCCIEWLQKETASAATDGGINKK